MRYFLYTNFHELPCTYFKYFQTQLGTEAYYLFFILSYYENEMYIVLIYVNYTHSNFNLDAILKRMQRRYIYV